MAKVNLPPVPQSKRHSNVLEGPELCIPELVTGLGSRYFETLEKYKDKIHQVDAVTGVTETKSSVKNRAIKIAIELRKRGVKENNVVVICSKTHMDQTVTILACLFIGAIVAPLHSDHPYDEIKHFVQILQPKCAFCGNRSGRLMLRIIKETNVRCPIYLFHGEAPDLTNFEKCFENKDDPNFVTAQIKNPRLSIAFIFCTPGTECESKMVSVTHSALIMRYMPLLNLMFTKGEKVISVFPLYDIIQVMMCCICFETTAKHIFIKLDSERGICKYIHDLRVENLVLDGDDIIRIVKNAPVGDFDLSCLKVIYVGGIPLTTGHFIKVAKTFKNINIITNYGTIESGVVSSMSPEILYQHRDKIHSVGLLQPGVSVRVVDTPLHKVHGPDSWGELLVKTSGMMIGYYKGQALTQKSFSKGYFKTGDLAQYDNDGFLFIKGRVSDEICKDDQIFSSVDIEEAIKTHPDVSEAACFATGTGDIIACVVKKDARDLTTGLLMEFIADILPPYKHPSKVTFREYLPKTLQGLVQKHRLRDTCTEVIREESFYLSQYTDAESADS